jgi:hypothetical protein
MKGKQAYITGRNNVLTRARCLALVNSPAYHIFVRTHYSSDKEALYSIRYLLLPRMDAEEINKRGEERIVVGWKPVPLDGGYGWVVVAASFLVHVLADGFIYSFGVLAAPLIKVRVDAIHQFNASLCVAGIWRIEHGGLHRSLACEWPHARGRAGCLRHVLETRLPSHY